MNRVFNRFLLISALLVVFVSCEKDQKLTLNSNASVSSLAASSTDVVLTTAVDEDSVLTINWATDYGYQPVVSYILQMDLPSDTSGTNAWANAKNITVTGNQPSYSFIGKTLNNMLSSLAVPAGAASVVSFRVVSNVNQINGKPSTVPTVYSSGLNVNITPYALSLYVPGAYQGWDPSKAPFLNPVTAIPGKFEGYYYMPGSGIQYFKYTNAPDWGHINYGDSSYNGMDGFMSVDGNAGGLYVADGGYIEVTADFNTVTWTATKTTWGIIGDATPGGWGGDTQMTYDPATEVWTVTAVMKQAGSFKFRANSDWKIDFGIDADGNLQYADNPFFPYNGSLNNLTVPADGTYLITLDLHVSGVYKYSLVKM